MDGAWTDSTTDGPTEMWLRQLPMVDDIDRPYVTRLKPSFGMGGGSGARSMVVELK